MSSDIVLGHPYVGGLYYLLSQQNPFIKGRAPRRRHHYYDLLYGDNPEENQIWAVNFAAVFENILLPPADEHFPDFRNHIFGDVYFNPEIRIEFIMD